MASTKAQERQAKHDKLVATLKAAKEAAEALKYTEDGGSCNFDKATISGIREADFAKAAEEAGVTFYDGKFLGRKVLFLSSPLSGQGNRRSRMAEAAEKVLRAAGYDTCMFYQMD